MATLVTDARLTDPNLPTLIIPGEYFRSIIKLNFPGGFVRLIAQRVKEEKAEFFESWVITAIPDYSHLDS